MPHVFGVYRKLPLLYERPANTYIFTPQGQITNPNNTTVYSASFNNAQVPQATSRAS
jgi:hypothetical protein